MGLFYLKLGFGGIHKVFRDDENTNVMKHETVPGKKTAHHVKIYTLSTCGWCKKTKELLKALDVAFEYVDVDKLSGEDYTEATEDVKKYNPYRTYPTIVIDHGKHVILGYKDNEIREKLR
jgi:glutaredoxin-like protein NrdH